MGRFILSFEQFLFEASQTEDSTQKDNVNAEVHQILIRNRDKIKDEANIDDFLFNQVVVQMIQDKPLSVDEDDIVDDAIKLSLMLKPEAEPFMKLDQGDKMDNAYAASKNGKTGVAVQNYDNRGSGDSLG